MSDLIDRQQVLNTIDKWIGYLDEDMICRIKTSINKIPATDSWIKTEDRLPPQDIPVLICATGHRVTAYYDALHEVFRLTEDDHLYYLTNKVSHWQPLPTHPDRALRCLCPICGKLHYPSLEKIECRLTKQDETPYALCDDCRASLPLPPPYALRSSVDDMLQAHIDKEEIQ